MRPAMLKTFRAGPLVMADTLTSPVAPHPMTGTYNEVLVLFSLLVAILASYTALDMARRARPRMARRRG